MSLFHRGFYAPDTSFGPLFRLLDDFDQYNRQQSPQTQGHRHHRHTPTFSPKFDVRETETAYELHGELAGMKKDEVSIQFVDAATMVVSGRIERTYEEGTRPTGLIEGTSMSGAITEQGEESKKNLHKATVEDEDTAEKQESASDDAEVVERKDKPKDSAKYWVSERSVGQFTRTFSFPGHVDQDSVSASFKDGILNIVVPKAKKPEARRIAVQ